ncbi:hypothetical protein GCM10029992_29020 [Glycomyces albus]
MSEETQVPETTEAEVTEAPVAEAPVEVPADVAAAPSVPSIPSVPADRPIQTVGRRKRAIARVRLVPGTGRYVINGKTLEDYFPSKVHQQTVAEPFVTVEAGDNFDVLVNIQGGGATGQAGALRLGIARALIEIDPNMRPALKAAGFLTRDSARRRARSTASRRPARRRSTRSASAGFLPRRERASLHFRRGCRGGHPRRPRFFSL